MSRPDEPVASAPLPANEEERLAALRSLAVLDTPPEPVFDGFARLAAAICGTPIGLISLIDSERQWFKARVGLEIHETPRQTSFCAHTILGRGALVVPDATIDPRFARNPHVLAAPHVRFYAGQPLVTAQGHALGALCVIDYVPRELTTQQLEALGLLAGQVVEVLELRRRARRAARVGDGATPAPAATFVAPAPLLPASASASRRRPHGIAVAVALAGVALTAAGFVASRRADERARAARFEAAAEALRDALNERLLAYEETLAGARAFAVARGPMSRQEWSAFATSLALTTRPGIVRLGYAQWLPAAERDGFERRLRREIPDFRLHPEGRRDAYLPIVRFAPQAGVREPMLGFDLLADPGRREAIARARRLGQAAMSRRVELLQGGRGVVMFMVVGPGDAPAGVVYAALRMAELVQGVPASARDRLDVEIFDGPSPVVDSLLFDGRPRDPARPDRQVLLPLNRAGRTLTLRVTGRPDLAAAASSREPWLVLMAGLLVSGLCAAIAWSAASTWVRARQLAARLARDATRAEERVRTLVDNVAEGILTFDQDGAVRWCNAAAERLFGAPAAALVGRSIEELVPAARGDLRDGFRNEALGRRDDGGFFPIELSVSEMREEDQPLFVALVRDATARREVERLKDEFVSTVSHELRTPLTSIRGSLGLLRAGVMGDLPAEASEVVAIAERNSERLLALINDILDIERLRAGQLELVRGPVAADELVAHAVEVTRGVATGRGVRLEIDACPNRVHGDQARLAQVLVNLLSNAVKFSPAGGPVRVAARRSGADVEFRVSDRGRGIPREHHELIFERFRQVEATDARDKGGSGLGLAICRALVEQHGGTIGVESEPGAGSTFWFCVPAATEEA